MIVFAYTADHIGIIPRAIVHVFEGKEREEDRDTVYTVHVSYMEIYNEQVFDLLADESLRNRYGTLTKFFFIFPFYEKSCEESITPQ